MRMLFMSQQSTAAATAVIRKHWLEFLSLVFTGLFVLEYSLEIYFKAEPKGVHHDPLTAVSSVRESVSVATPSTTNGLDNHLWEELDLQYCKFPDFYDVRRRRYSLWQEHWVESGWKRREELKAESYQFDPSKVTENTHEYYQMMLRKQQPRFNFTSLDISRNISFISIGKAGGSSIGCHLAEARKYVRKHCQDELMHKPVPMSALSLHVNCFNHMSGHLYCYDVNQAFLVNTRHPIKRLASWFLYEHPQNHPVNYAERQYHCGDLMLFSCYPTFDAFATLGLAAGSPTPKDTPLRMGPNLTATECSHWAWAAVQGSIPATYHNFYNYDWYTHRLFSLEDDDTIKQNEDKDIYVLRAEHLENDWITINNMLSGSGANHNSSAPSTLQSRQNSASQKVLPVSDNTASSIGIRNLCRALCREIQIYKKLLALAANLQQEDVGQSVEELRAVCPVEAGIQEPQQCDER